MLFLTFKVTAMLTYMKYEISFAPCCIGPPRVVCKAGRTNMVPKHESIRLENTSDQSLHNDLMDPCTFYGI